MNMAFKKQTTRIALVFLLSLLAIICNQQTIQAKNSIYGTYTPIAGGGITIDIYETNNYKERKTIELLDSYIGVDVYLFEWNNKENGTIGRYLIYASPEKTNRISIVPIGTKKRETWIKIK